MFLYNTVCEIVLREYPGEATPLLDGCEEIARGVQAMLNAYDPASQLGRLNREHRVGEPCMVSPRLYALLRRMDRFSAACGGAFDATVRPLVALWDFTSPSPAVPPKGDISAAMAHCGYHRVRYNDDAFTVTFTAPGMAIDAGGVGKGYAAGQVAEYLRARDVRSASINFGGELYLLGPCAGEEGAEDWRVGIQRPGAPRGETLGTLALRDAAVASSGGYDRFFEAGGQTYCHILDPRTGYPVQGGVEGVTVICGDPVAAELFSTAFYVLGREDARRLAAASNPAPDYLIAGRDGIAVSQGLSARFEAAGACRRPTNLVTRREE